MSLGIWRLSQAVSNWVNQLDLNYYDYILSAQIFLFHWLHDYLKMPYVGQDIPCKFRDLSSRYVIDKHIIV